MRQRDGAVRKTKAGRGIVHAQGEAAGRDGAGADVTEKAETAVWRIIEMPVENAAGKEAHCHAGIDFNAGGNAERIGGILENEHVHAKISLIYTEIIPSEKGGEGTLQFNENLAWKISGKLGKNPFVSAEDIALVHAVLIEKQ